MQELSTFRPPARRLVIVPTELFRIYLVSFLNIISVRKTTEHSTSFGMSTLCLVVIVTPNVKVSTRQKPFVLTNTALRTSNPTTKKPLATRRVREMQRLLCCKHKHLECCQVLSTTFMHLVPSVAGYTR